MAFSITMYSTTFDRYNRAMNKTSLETYLSALDSTKYTVYDTGYQIMPNTSFIVKTSALTITPISAYNYLSAYWLDDNGEQHIYYVGFIDSVDFLANGTARINHTMDYWCNIFYMDNVSFIDGTVTRAHSNDVTNSMYYNPYSTFNAPEEQFNTDALMFGTYKPRYGINTLTSFNSTQYWLYVYIANPWSVFDDNSTNRALISQTYFAEDGTGIPNLGVTFCYPCLFSVSNIAVYLINSGSSEGFCSILDFTNENITSMLFSTIPPTTSLSLNSATGLYVPTATANPSFMSTVEGMGFSSASLVHAMGMIPISMQDCVGLASYKNSDISTTYNLLTNEERYYGFIRSVRPLASQSYAPQTYQISTDVPKAQSLSYNPMYIDNIAITNQNLPFAHTSATGGTYSTGFYVGVGGDLTTYAYTIIPQGTSTTSTFAGATADSVVYTKNIVSSFSPTVIKDYWTRLNASIESMKATQTQITSVINGVSSVISSIFAPVSALTGTAQSASKGNVIGAMGSGVGALGSAWTSELNAASSVVDSYYNYKTAGANKEIAQYQYQKGITNESGAMYLSGAFLMNDLPTIYTVCNYDNRYKYNLHKKGVATNISCNDTGAGTSTLYPSWAFSYFTGSGSELDIDAHFKRTHFNYVEAEGVSLSYVNSAYNANISNMFAQGVTLWRCDSTDDVANVGNYSILNVIG